MDPVLIVVIILAVLVIGTLLRSVRIVPQAKSAVVERLGRYTRTQGPGVAVLVPFVDRMRPLIAEDPLEPSHGAVGVELSCSGTRWR